MPSDPEDECFSICIVLLKYCSTIFCNFQHIIFTGFIKYIPTYFILLDVMVHRIVSDSSLLLYVRLIFVSILYSATLLNSLNLIVFFNRSLWRACHLKTDVVFLSNINVFYFLFLLNFPPRTSMTMLKRSGKTGPPCLFHNL